MTETAFHPIFLTPQPWKLQAEPAGVHQVVRAFQRGEYRYIKLANPIKEDGKLYVGRAFRSDPPEAIAFWIPSEAA